MLKQNIVYKLRIQDKIVPLVKNLNYKIHLIRHQKGFRFLFSSLLPKTIILIKLLT